MDDVHGEGAEGASKAEDGRGEPLGEGAEVGTEEGIGGVEEAVVRPESAAGEAHQPHPGPQRIQRVRPRARHRLRWAAAPYTGLSAGTFPFPARQARSVGSGHMSTPVSV